MLGPVIACWSKEKMRAMKVIIHIIVAFNEC